MAALRLGAIGDAVRQVQAGLNLLPTQLLRLKIDGIFGVRTQGRVLEFQRFNRIAQDGVVGDITLGLIETLLRNLGLWPPPDPGPGPSAGAVRPINNEMVGMTGLGNLYEQILPSRMMVDMTSYVRNSDGNVFRFRPIPMMVCRAGIFAARKGDMERVVILVLPRDVKADRLCICITQGFGQAAADLDRSLGRLDAAAQLDRLVTGLQQAAGRLDAYAASLIGSDDIIVDEAASLILHLNRKVTDRAHSMRNACENLEQSDRLLAEKAKRKSFMDHILTIPLDGEDD